MLTKFLNTNGHLVIALAVIGAMAGLVAGHDVTANVAVPVVVAAAGLGAVGQAQSTPPKTP